MVTFKLAVCIAGIVGQCHLAHAWSADGHGRIVNVAANLIKGRRRNRINAMLDGDLAELGGWERDMTRKHPETGMLHWHVQEPEWTCSALFGAKDKIRCDQNGAERGSLFCALTYFFGHFAHDTLLNEYPKLEEPHKPPDELAVLSRVTISDLTPAMYLRWMTALVADLHQPLHLLRPLEAHGALVKVRHRGKEHSLLSFWEETLPEALPPPPHQHVLDQHFRIELKRWRARGKLKTPIELMQLWAREVAAAACKEVYQKVDISGDTPFDISEELYSRWLNISHELTWRAGERVAFILLEILQHEEHRLAHKEGRGRWHHTSLLRPVALIYNFCIGLVVVPLLLGVLMWHERLGRQPFVGKGENSKK